MCLTASMHAGSQPDAHAGRQPTAREALIAPPLEDQLRMELEASGSQARSQNESKRPTLINLNHVCRGKLSRKTYCVDSL